MASQTQGIQQLLAAEKKAAEKVQDARRRKARRLKQAKEEATVEIERFKQEREKTFREYEAKHMGSRGDVAVKIDQELVVKLESMKKSVAANKDRVIEDLLNRVVGEIKPELHRNLRLGHNA